MGHTMFSVSIVQFVRGKLSVVCEKSDKVGGRDMDECLMRVFAGQFQKKHGCDPLSNKKASFKLEDSVSKTKKILSANNEAGVNVECLMEDEDFSSTMTRADFEAMCQPMMDKVKAVLEGAKAMSTVPLDQIDAVEIVGGAVRVPWVKKMLSEAFGGKELSTTMNQEESVARGCALQAAILSPLYKVRDFKVEDTSPYAVNVGWMGSAADAEAKKEDEEGDTQMTGGEGEYKTATVFPASTQVGILKMLTFYRKGPFDIKAEYLDPAQLLPGTAKDLGTFKVDLAPQTEPKKVKVKAKLTLSGCFAIEGEHGL
jgi:heat shock protein 4